MAIKKEFNLKPGLGVDLVFDLDSLSPSTRSSIIFDSDETKRQVVVAQPTQRINPETINRTMHISSLIHSELSSKIRMGYACRVIEALNGYKLANQGRADALLIEYIPPPLEINIRAAYRFHPNTSHEVMGKLIYNNEIYYSGREFKFHNISINGVGLLIPKKILKKRNPLLDIHLHSLGKIGIILKNNEENELITTIDSDLRVVRTNLEFNPMSGFAGCRLTNLQADYEEMLNKFIHNAQLHEIRKLNRLK
ncbi:MAG: hypothetical protein KKD44_21625 [Proteobacteria bacterium]|nr:hypothetical protein [Pseudomonadota bacterium]